MRGAVLAALLCLASRVPGQDVKPDFARAQKRAALLPEEKRIWESIQRDFKAGEREFALVAWGPHLLEGVVWPPVKDPHDITVVVNDVDRRRPCKLLRVTYEDIWPQMAYKGRGDFIYLVIDGRVQRFDGIAPGDAWTAPYLDFRKNSGFKPR